MNIHQLNQMFEAAALTDPQKDTLLEKIRTPQTTSPKKKAAVVWALLAAICLLLPSPAIQSFFQAKDVQIKLADDRLYEDLDDDVSINVLSPELTFYIDGENIAEISLRSEKEYVYAIDFTETQDDSKYWAFNPEYSKSPHLRYEKECHLSFESGFDDHEEILYHWIGYDLLQWSQEAKERRKAGYIQLEHYPAPKLEDTITITITDRWDNVTTNYLHITFENEPDSIKTHLTAYVSDSPEKEAESSPDWVTFKIGDDNRTYEQMEEYADHVRGTSLEFYVDGTDIASVTIESKKEFVTAYGTIAEDQLHGWQDRELKKLTLEFEKEFDVFEEVHYRWRALDLLSWAQEKEERILGGQIQLSEYPGGVLEDIVTITVTNHFGETVIKKMHITVTNDDRKRTMIKAYIE